jgi:hypothetical protein
MLIACIVCACSDSLDIVRDYGYGVETLPLPKSLERGETVALEFSIVREGYYSETAYKFRYFQSEGKGRLTDSYGTAIPMNRFQNISSDDFVLYYRSECEEQQQLDFVFENNFGQRLEYTLTFGNKKAEEEPEDISENPQPEPEDDEPEENPDDDISPGEEPETVPDGNGTEPDNTPDIPENEEPEDTPENPQPEPEDVPEENPDNGTSPDEEPETVPDGDETEPDNTPDIPENEKPEET